MGSIILLTQTKTTAALEIIVILVIAALIGYLTSYFYYKAIYTKKINELIKEKENLNAKIAGLQAEKSNLEQQVQKLQGDIEKLKEKDKKKPQGRLISHPFRLLC